MYSTLLFSVTDRIATISFHRPKDMNCFDDVMAEELLKITELVSADKNIRAVLLNGTGHLFSAGGDIRFFHENLDRMPQGVHKIVHMLNASIHNLMLMPKPVLASVHGAVAGVGVSLMSACDMVIAADNTRFTMGYCGLGISPDGGASYLLPRTVGTKKAMEWLMMSDIFDAKAALSHGLINWIVAPELLQAETQRILAKLVSGPTQSYASIKKLVNMGWQNTLDGHLEQEALGFEACSVTKDFRAGVTGFLNKQKAEFVGE